MTERVVMMRKDAARTVTAYHGTSPENARAILDSGAFRENTWFAYKKWVSLKFGGPIVFVVKLDRAGFRNIDVGPMAAWQFHLREPLSTDVVTHMEGETS